MTEGLLQGIVNVFSPVVFLWMFLGVIIGLVVGTLPLRSRS
jgi:TctA family transporter